MSTTAAWGSCPECEADIKPDLATCRECGFPLKPKPAGVVATSPSPARATTRTRKRRRAFPRAAAHEDAPLAMVFAILGLFMPLLAVFGLMASRKGSAARVLSWVGIGLWVVGAVLIAARVLHRTGSVG